MTKKTSNENISNKSLDYYLSLPYSIELIPDEDGSWFASIPLLDGCMTTGTDAHDALDMIMDAKKGWLMTAIEIGIDIPEPKFDEEKSSLVIGYVANTNTGSVTGVTFVRDISIVPKPQNDRDTLINYSPRNRLGMLKEEAR